MLYWLYQFLPSILGIKVASYVTDLIQMVPYVVTIIVLVVVSFRKKKKISLRKVWDFPTSEGKITGIGLIEY